MGNQANCHDTDRILSALMHADTLRSGAQQ